MEKQYSISQVAAMLGINIQTLRRWDESDLLPSRRKGKSSHRYYLESDVENYLNNNFRYLLKLAEKWASNKSPNVLPPLFYCQHSSAFKGRLTKLEANLFITPGLKEKYSLITSIVGEIGNNSFDHNLGNWRDVPGIFFGYNLTDRQIILVDRGQGILNTLRRVRPELNNDQAALKVAFTELVSARAPESRGNGLKYVREIVMDKNNGLQLFFRSGKAELKISGHRRNLNIKESQDSIPGCFALIYY